DSDHAALPAACGESAGEEGAITQRAPMCSTAPRRTQPLLLLLLPLPLNIKLRLLAIALHGSFPFELVPINRELVINVDRVLPNHPLGGERQLRVLQFHVLEFRVLLVRPV